jgi:tetrahydromethanopterin S-methyltransferase subunit E
VLDALLSHHSCPAGYSAAIVFTIICMLLYNVQQDIEQPFDVSRASAVCVLAQCGMQE